MRQPSNSIYQSTCLSILIIKKDSGPKAFRNGSANLYMLGKLSVVSEFSKYKYFPDCFFVFKRKLTKNNTLT